MPPEKMGEQDMFLRTNLPKTNVKRLTRHRGNFPKNCRTFRGGSLENLRGKGAAYGMPKGMSSRVRMTKTHREAQNRRNAELVSRVNVGEMNIETMVSK